MANNVRGRATQPEAIWHLRWLAMHYLRLLVGLLVAGVLGFVGLMTFKGIVWYATEGTCVHYGYNDVNQWVCKTGAYWHGAGWPVTILELLFVVVTIGAVMLCVRTGAADAD